MNLLPLPDLTCPHIYRGAVDGVPKRARCCRTEPHCAHSLTMSEAVACGHAWPEKFLTRKEADGSRAVQRTFIPDGKRFVLFNGKIYTVAK